MTAPQPWFLTLELPTLEEARAWHKHLYALVSFATSRQLRVTLHGPMTHVTAEPVNPEEAA